MKTIALTMLLVAAQANAGELLMDCYFGGRQVTTFSLANLDIQDGACHTGNIDKSEGPVKIRYQIELCGMDATGSVMTSSQNNSNWERVMEFSSKKECQLRRKIESLPRRCIPARSHC